MVDFHSLWRSGPARTTSGGRLSRAAFRRLGLAVTAALVVLPAFVPAGRVSAGAPAARWLTSWAPSPAPAGTADPYLTASMPDSQAHDQSVRMIVRSTAPGSRIRLR